MPYPVMYVLALTVLIIGLGVIIIEKNWRIATIPLTIGAAILAWVIIAQIYATPQIQTVPITTIKPNENIGGEYYQIVRDPFTKRIVNLTDKFGVIFDESKCSIKITYYSWSYGIYMGPPQDSEMELITLEK